MRFASAANALHHFGFVRSESKPTKWLGNASTDFRIRLSLDRCRVSPSQLHYQIFYACNERVQSFIEGKEIKKEIYVPGKIVNIVAV